MTDLCIRPARDIDVETIRRILWMTWDSTYSPFIPENDLKGYFDGHYAEERILEHLLDSHIKIFVAELQGSAVGTMITRYSPEEDRMYVSSLYILPDHQGKGIGGNLLREAEERARSLGVDAIWLGVMVQNTRAVEWYEKIGFQFNEREPFVMGNSTVEHLIGFRLLPKKSGP